MSDAIIVAVISGVCTLLGSCGGVLASSRLTQYRLSALEKQVNRHNQVIERTFRLEGRMDEAEHDIRDLKSRTPHTT
ncbi:MAG: hypothetical protein IJZ74_10670 [Clostridia bacterium]|nr:hypothetical protein [Clostridia bacterium]